MNPSHSPRRLGRARRPSTTRPILEILEDRTVPSVTNVLVNSTLADTTSQDTQSEPAVVLGSGSLPASAAGIVAQYFHNVVALYGPGQSPGGYWPSQVRHAYGFDQLSLDGTGQTIAIVDAYDDPNLSRDLAAFDSQFNLPAPPSFHQVSQTGGPSSGVPTDFTGGWEVEEALDVEWAHAIAPKANILLVEANSDSLSDLLTAVAYAASQPNVVAVSMSWGGNEFSGQSSFDSYFTTPAGHKGITFVAASGDNGTPAGWPASSPNVLAVGGTSLSLNASDNRVSESGWTDSGGGYSAVYGTPSYQQTYAQSSYVQNTLNNTVLLAGSRGNPDVSYAADPSPGFAVYDSFPYFGTSYTWFSVGGTSAGSPQWAALIALADQQRGASGSLDGPSQTLPDLYKLAASSTTYTRDFYDVTSGYNGFSAQAGYDLVTGLGSPQANNLIPDLAGNAASSVYFTVSAPSSVTAGSPFNLTVTAHNPDGTIDASYTGTVQFTSTDGQAVPPANYTFTTTATAAAGTTPDNGVHIFSVTLKTAGSQTVTATDTASSSITGNTSVTVNPALAASLAFGQQPTTTLAGATITPAVTVKVLDAYGNLVTSDNTDSVSLAITGGTGTAGATLSGGGPATVSGGVARFGSLSIDKAGTGYTLTASSGTLTGATSASFNILSTKTIEDFESGNLSRYTVVGATTPTAAVSTVAAHDGTFGLKDTNGNDWIFRNDAAAQVKEGDSISVWVQLNSFTDGRAYFGFGASASGTLSVVLAPNTGQFLIQNNSGFGFSNIGAANQPAGGYQANHWYRLEVDWSTSGSITGKLFDSDGKTLLDTVTATTPSGGPTSGGIAFRAFGHNKYWDTVTDTPGVNTTSPHSIMGTPAVNNPAADQADGGNDEFAAALNTPGQASAVLPRPAGVPAQGAAASPLPLVQAALVAGGPAPVLTPLPSVPSGVPAVPPTAGPVLTVQAFLPSVNRLGSGGGG
ncbi:MAG TPA: hypothetical protein VKD72_29735, partial [Gemmataceae bacterium]|nr:hypothetical protein [Gemmataceae bacterium]